MLGSMTSLTGGGGFQGGSASSSTGDQNASIGFQGGSLNMGGGIDEKWLIAGAVLVAVVWLWKK